jgi:hypothetical protein
MDFASQFLLLASRTATTWWLCLTRLLPLYAVAYTLAELLQIAASWVSLYSAWPALLIAATSLTVKLAGIVLCFNLMGRDLALRDPAFARLSPELRGEAGLSQLAQTLSVTLLAFLGIYSVFDYIEEMADSVMIQAIVIRGTVYGDETPLLGPLSPTTWPQRFTAIGVVVAVWLLGKAAELIRDKAKRPTFGLVAAWCETLFIFLTLFVGYRLLRDALNWLQGRQVAGWAHAVAGWFAELPVNLPAALAWLWAWFWDVAWPVVGQTVVEPLVWLALAALVLGSQVITFRELLTSLRSRGERGRVGRLAGKVADSSLGRKVEQFDQDRLGDLGGKYLPTFLALRLVLRSGAGLLAGFIVLYSAWAFLEEVAWWSFTTGWGPHDLEVTSFGWLIRDFFEGVIFDLPRYALLVSAYSLALTAWLRREEGGSPGTGVDALATAGQIPGSRSAGPGMTGAESGARPGMTPVGAGPGATGVEGVAQ